MGKLAKQKQAALGDKYIGKHGTRNVVPGGKAKKARREAAQLQKANAKIK